MQCLSILTITLILFINNISPFCNGSWLFVFPFLFNYDFSFCDIANTMLFRCCYAFSYVFVPCGIATQRYCCALVKFGNHCSLHSMELWLKCYSTFFKCYSKCFVTLLIRNVIVHLQSLTNVSVISTSLCLFSNIFCVHCLRLTFIDFFLLCFILCFKQWSFLCFAQFLHLFLQLSYVLSYVCYTNLCVHDYWKGCNNYYKCFNVSNIVGIDFVLSTWSTTSFHSLSIKFNYYNQLANYLHLPLPPSSSTCN